MNPQTEQIFATLELLLEEQIICRLPYNHTSNWEPFLWDFFIQGNSLDVFSLLKNEGWIQFSDIENAIESWQEIEQRGTPTRNDNYAESRLDDEWYEEIRNTTEFSHRKIIYTKLAKSLQENLNNLQIYQLSCNSDYDEGYFQYIIVGQIENGDWICVTSTVPRETPDFEDILVSEKVNFDSNQMPICESSITYKNQVENILEALTPITICGHYDGGYDHSYEHQMLCRVGATQNQVIKEALISSGLLQISHFKKFYPDSQEYIFTDYSGREEGTILFEKYQHLNKFLNAKLPELIMYKFNFWNYTHVFIVGQSVDDDWVGLSLKSEFDYNP